MKKFRSQLTENIDLKNSIKPKIKQTKVIYSIIFRTLLIPPDGWWIIILECGSACLLPFAPAANKTLPMLQACPIHQVDTSGLMYIMVS